MSKTVFVSTSIPYVNGRPHIGHALEFVQADVISRYHRLQGHNTFFLTGTDENSLKNVRAAAEAGIPTQELCDRNSGVFQALVPALHISNDDFIRTSRDIRHALGAQKFWTRTRPGDIYKKSYSGRYCVGCEDFYTEKEMPDGICPEHQTPLEVIEEENYFFRLSAYQDQLFDLLESGRLQVIPDSRRNEMLAFMTSGLQDFSISRSRERAGHWGIPVPGDENQVMYVWFDALTNYITALNYSEHDAPTAAAGERFQTYWLNDCQRIHVIGKGINRFHAIYWPAMLLSTGLPLPDVVFVHGYLTANGQKISKSLGNVVDPLAHVEKYGAEAVRYYLLRGVSPFEDGDYAEHRVRELYNADLANNLGNLIRRIETLGDKAGYVLRTEHAIPAAPDGFCEAVQEFRFHDAAAALWNIATGLNQEIDRIKPWELQKQGKEQELDNFLDQAVSQIRQIGHWLEPLLPAASKKITLRFHGGKPLKQSEPLFPRWL